MSGSWVTRTIVIPARFSSWRSARISMLVCVSRFPVGSSARITGDRHRNSPERMDGVRSEAIVLGQVLDGDERHAQSLSRGLLPAPGVGRLGVPGAPAVPVITSYPSFSSP